MNAIEIRNVHYNYKPGVPVLEGLSLDIEAGEMVAIQGPSGSGKSTLLYLIGGFLNLNQGSIKLYGQRLSDLNETSLASFRSRTLGFIFQQFHLLQRCNVIQNVELAGQYPVELQGRDKQELRNKSKAICEQLGLGDLLDHHPNQLSGGQQQRVAIGRALLNDPAVLLADEPTGNLDTQTAQQIMDLLRDINRQGKTVVIITHDSEIAHQCHRIIHVRDGRIQRMEELVKAKNTVVKEAFEVAPPTGVLGFWFKLLGPALSNIFRNRSRSFLTMIGVMIGVAAVMSMITFGEFTQKQVLKSYQTMGANKVVLEGYRNWNLRAVDQTGVAFDGFDWELDIAPFMRAFPEARMGSPSLVNWNRDDVTFGGRAVQNKALAIGVSQQAFAINDLKVAYGQPITSFHVDSQLPVCVVGSGIVSELFSQMSPLGRRIKIDLRDSKPYSCRIIGVLAEKSSNDEWRDPNYQILMPYSFFKSVNPEWYGRMQRVMFKLEDGKSIEDFNRAATKYFENKYGIAGRFHAHSDSILLNHIKQFVILFKVLLGAIAMISLLVGGMGIANMMLASLSEQLREIGIRKAHGATNRSVQYQYLLESVALCSISGVLGIFVGFSTYQLIIYMAAQVVEKLEFQWVINPMAIVVSFIAIFVVGILSGLVPSLKAARLQVIDALRAE